MVGGGVMAIIGWGVTMELGGRERGRRRNSKNGASLETTTRTS